MLQEKTKFYTLQADPVFKNVFYRDTNLLKRFLTDILSRFYDNLHIDSVTILNTELSKDRLYIKNKTVDILVDIGSKKINCDMNLVSMSKKRGSYQIISFFIFNFILHQILYYF